MQRKKGSSYFPSNQSFSSLAHLRSEASCLDLLPKIHFDLPLKWANSNGFGGTARMRSLAWILAACICYNSSFLMTRLIYDGYSCEATLRRLLWIPTKKKGKRKVQGVPQSQTAALPDTKRERKQTKPNKRKSNKRTKSTKISSVFPRRDNRNAKRTEKHKKKITQGKT